MLDISHAKSMARTLRDGLSERRIALSHSDCLELVAGQFGFANWNVLAARLVAPKAFPAPALVLPKGWVAAGSVTAVSHRIGIDPKRAGAIPIACLFDRAHASGVLNDQIAFLMQSIRADRFLGQRLRFSADLRGLDADCGTIWMRVDGRARPSLAFDNMLTRTEDGAVRGQTGWVRRSVVLDVPEEAASLHYGVFLKGYGKVWARDVRLEPVGSEIPVTGVARTAIPQDSDQLAAGPTNLKFRAA